MPLMATDLVGYQLKERRLNHHKLLSVSEHAVESSHEVVLVDDVHQYLERDCHVELAQVQGGQGVVRAESLGFVSFYFRLHFFTAVFEMSRPT